MEREKLSLSGGHSKSLVRAYYAVVLGRLAWSKRRRRSWPCSAQRCCSSLPCSPHTCSSEHSRHLRASCRVWRGLNPRVLVEGCRCRCRCRWVILAERGGFWTELLRALLDNGLVRYLKVPLKVRYLKVPSKVDFGQQNRSKLFLRKNFRTKTPKIAILGFFC